MIIQFDAMLTSESNSQNRGEVRARISIQRLLQPSRPGGRNYRIQIVEHVNYTLNSLFVNNAFHVSGRFSFILAIAFSLLIHTQIPAPRMTKPRIKPPKLPMKSLTSSH